MEQPTKRGPRLARTTGDHLSVAAAALARARFHLDQVPIETRSLLPLAADLEAQLQELDKALAIVNEARREIAARLSAILDLDIRHRTVAEIGSAVRRLTDHNEATP
jgi:hypothetical protein